MYRPAGADFIELGGEGMAMGVVEDTDYRDYLQQGWEPGSVVVIGTDGITETRNRSGELFGSERTREVIRTHAASSAADIQAAVIEAVHTFRGETPQEDDVTLVVVKLL
jgi:sigma-B regulation protein RsbU (phosphoserine phosphatase)